MFYLQYLRNLCTVFHVLFTLPPTTHKSSCLSVLCKYVAHARDLERHGENPTALAARNSSCIISRISLCTTGCYGADGPRSLRIILPCAPELSHFSHVWLFATLWTVVHQTPLPMEQVAMPFPQLRDQTRVSYVSALAGDSLSLAPPGERNLSLHPEI